MVNKGRRTRGRGIAGTLCGGQDVLDLDRAQQALGNQLIGRDVGRTQEGRRLAALPRTGRWAIDLHQGRIGAPLAGLAPAAQAA